MYRHTKIVATVGPSCGEPEQLENLLKAGDDVFRLNFSHGELEQKKIWIDQIRELSILHRKAVSILGDLQGPKIRTGMMRGGVQTLTRGQQVIVTTVDLEGDDGIIPTNYQDLPDDVEAGDRILLDDGQLELEVVRSSGVEAHCLVKQGGLLKDRKGINLPGVKVSTPALTTKDYVDLEFAIAQELDWVALSFVRTAAEICQLKQIIFDHHSPIRVIAKINLFELTDLCRGADKGEGHPIKFLGDGKLEINVILGGQSRGRDLDPGQVDPFAIFEQPPLFDQTMSLHAAAAHHFEFQLTIIEENPIASLDVIGKILIIGRDDAVIPFEVNGGDDHLLATGQCLYPAAHHAGANFW